MGAISTLGRIAWRLFQTDGVPASGVNSPSKAEIFDFVDEIDDKVTALEGGGVRVRLTAPRTYYVRTDGSNANTGLVDNAGGAFLTITHAINVVTRNLDLSSQTVTIQVRPGTYNENLGFTGGLVGADGGGSVMIIGDETTPSNIVINGSGGATLFAISYAPDWKVKGVKITNVDSYGAHGHAGAWLRLTNVEFGVCGGGIHVFADHRGVVELIGNYKISAGAAQYHILTNDGGYVLVTGAVVTLVGTPAFGRFAFALGQSHIVVKNDVSFVGSATGQRYSSEENSLIATGGLTFPGDVAGGTATGGIVT